MKQNFRRLATAAALAFATVASTLPATAQETETQPPATGQVTYKAAGEPRVLLSCTKDSHAFRILAVPGAPASIVDTAPDSVPAKEFMDGMEQAVNAVISKYDFSELTASEAPMGEVNQAIRDYLLKFNADNNTRMAWAILDFGLTAEKDAACTPKAPAP